MTASIVAEAPPLLFRARKVSPSFNHTVDGKERIRKGVRVVESEAKKEFPLPQNNAVEPPTVCARTPPDVTSHICPMGTTKSTCAVPVPLSEPVSVNAVQTSKSDSRTYLMVVIHKLDNVRRQMMGVGFPT